MVLFFAQTLGSAVDTCYASAPGRLRTVCSHFLREGTRNLRSIPVLLFWWSSCYAEWSSVHRRCFSLREPVALENSDITATSPSHLAVPGSLSRCCQKSCLRIFWEPSIANSCWSSRAHDAHSVSTICGHTHFTFLSPCQKQQQRRQQQQYNLERLRFNRRGASTPLWGVKACSLPSKRPNPIPAIPPYVVRTPHLHGAPKTEEKQLNSDTNASNETYLK